MATVNLRIDAATKQEWQAECSAWKAIQNRCYRTTAINYRNYGWRGIVMCQGWRKSVLSFLADMGHKPSPQHSIERLDGNANYSCGHCEECLLHEWVLNCKWATRIEQNNNTRRNRFVTFYGKTMTLANWSRVAQINPVTVRNRLARGSSEKEAMWTQVVALTHDQCGRFIPDRKLRN